MGTWVEMGTLTGSVLIRLHEFMYIYPVYYNPVAPLLATLSGREDEGLSPCIGLCLGLGGSSDGSETRGNLDNLFIIGLK